MLIHENPQITINTVETANALYNTLQSIISKIAVCEYYGTIFMGSPQFSPDLSDASRGELERTLLNVLSDFYCEVVVFVVKARGFFDSRRGICPTDIHFFHFNLANHW